MPEPGRPGPPRDTLDPLSRLPHRGPARLPERGAILVPGSRAAGWRTLGSADDCLNDAGVLPSVLLVELMAQVGGLLMSVEEGSPDDAGVLAGIKKMHLHGAPRAGETVSVECDLERRLGDLYMVRCRAWAGLGGDRRELAHGTIQIRRVRGGGGA